MESESILLEFIGVTDKAKGFGLKNIDFKLERGYILGLVGKNGSGKTTLLHHIVKNKRKYQGEILFEGKNIKNQEVYLKDHVAFISEEQEFFEALSLKENGDLLGSFYTNWSMESFLQTLEQFHLWEKQKIAGLSRGEYMKFQLAFAMAHQAKLYLVDEATAGMDVVFRKEFYQILKKIVLADASAIIATHNETEVYKNMDYIANMEDGRLSSFLENVQ